MNVEQPENKEKVLRQPQEETHLERSKIPLISHIVLAVILSLVLHLVNFGLSFVISEIFGLAVLLPTSMLSIIILILTGIYTLISYLNYESVSYSMISGSIEKTVLNTIDKIPGKILAEEGFFYRTKTLLSMNEYDHIRIDKSPTGRIYNYGNINLLQKDELEMTKNYVLTNVQDPEETSRQIQRMMDVEISKATPIPEKS